jgi:hypothetical protein
MANIKIGLDIGELNSGLNKLDLKLKNLSTGIDITPKLDENNLTNSLKELPNKLGSTSKNLGEKIGKDTTDGVKEGLKGVGDIFKNALSFAGGSLLAGGLSGLFTGVKEALKQGDDAADRLNTSFQQAKLSGKGLADELSRSGKSAKDISNDFALPVNQIKG